MKEFLSHLFIPRESNNHRAKILHNTNLFITIIFFVFSIFFVNNFSGAFPQILGVSTGDITAEALLLLTNRERQNNGAGSLVLNPKLAEAASRKADDMFQFDYWAHNSPQGKTPWVFIKGSGYNYIYAGENLARGFTSTEDTIRAWMASPQHRANMLSSNYKDVGFAIKIGKLNGEETVLIVEELGNQGVSIPVAVAKPVQKATSSNQETRALGQKNSLPQTVPQTVPQIANKPLVNTLTFSSNINMIILSIFIFALLVDMMIVERKKIARFVGHNVDHVFYLLFIFLLVGLLSKGVIA